MSMDKVLQCKEKAYVSPPINLRKFLVESVSCDDRMHGFFTPSVPYADVPTTSTSDEPLNKQDDSRRRFLEFLKNRQINESIGTEAIQLVDDTLAEMYERCPIGEFELTFPPDDTQLETHRVLNDFRQKMKVKEYKSQYLMRGKYYKRFPEEGIRSENDMIMTVHLLTPCNKATERNEIQTNRIKVETRLLVRGDMPLQKLAEKIFCASDFWCNLEDTEDASNPRSYYLHQFPSKFIFIHDTFYINEGQDGIAIDITEPIRKFMNRKLDEFGPYQVKNLSDVKIIDLNLRLGQPYVFQHQGTCEHLVIFSDLRLLHPSDEQRLSEYPIKVYYAEHQILCCACAAAAPVYIVMESDRMPVTPAFMCGDCLKSFHYDRKKRIGNFIAYHYIDRAGIE